MKSLSSVDNHLTTTHPSCLFVQISSEASVRCPQPHVPAASGSKLMACLLPSSLLGGWRQTANALCVHTKSWASEFRAWRKTCVHTGMHASRGYVFVGYNACDVIWHCASRHGCIYAHGPYWAWSTTSASRPIGAALCTRACACQAAKPA